MIAEHFTELSLQGGSRVGVKGQAPPRVAPSAIVTRPYPQVWLGLSAKVVLWQQPGLGGVLGVLHRETDFQ